MGAFRGRYIGSLQRQTAMRKILAQSVAPLLSSGMFICAVVGGVMGQLVMGISVHHDGSYLGLAIALVFVLSAGASVTLFLNHRHVEQRPRTEPAPIQRWLLTLGTAMIASIWYGHFF